MTNSEKIMCYFLMIVGGLWLYMYKYIHYWKKLMLLSAAASLTRWNNLNLSLSLAMLYPVFISCILQSFNWSLINWIHIFCGRPWGRSQGFKLSNKADLAGSPSGSLHKCPNQLILLLLIWKRIYLLVCYSFIPFNNV